MWNQAGLRPPVCDVLERLARIEDPTATVWKGPGLPEEHQGIKVLGSPLGHLERTSTEHQVLLDRIPLVQDVQSTWLFLLHCACARANYLLRVVRPSAAVNFAETHDRAVWQCLGEHSENRFVRVFRGRSRCRHFAVYIGWAWSQEGHACQWSCSLGQLGRLLPHDPRSAPSCRHCASSSLGRSCCHPWFEPPSWRDVVAGTRPSRNEVEEFEWGCGAGWQHEAGARVERHHRDSHIFPRLADPAKALLRSQGGPGSSLAFSTSPTCRITRLGSHHFRLHWLRRLQLPLPLTVRSCRCGRPLDIYGHHRAACARVGVLGRRGFALESVVARICREAVAA